MKETPVMHMLLADSELEMVPEKYWSRSAVSANARKRGKKASETLLDSSLHHSIFTDHRDRNRRGRPDIAHFFLVNGLDSILNLKGKLRLYIHTRNDELIEVDPSTRIPKTYNRFKGLIENLFHKKAVPADGKPLLKLTENMDYDACMERIREGSSNGEIISLVLHNEGERINPYEFFKKMTENGELEEKDIVLTLGGFSHGDFNSNVKGDKRVSLHPDLLKVWTVQCEMIVGFRQSLHP